MRKNVFDEGIIASSHFRSLSKDAQLLYFHLSPDMVGVINDMTRVLDSLGMSMATAQELVIKKFLIDLGESIYLQKHWHINNNLDSRRLSTRYAHKLQEVYVRSNLSYTLNKEKSDSRLTYQYLGRIKTQIFFKGEQIHKADEEAETLNKIANIDWVGDDDE